MDLLLLMSLDIPNRHWGLSRFFCALCKTHVQVERTTETMESMTKLKMMMSTTTPLTGKMGMQALKTTTMKLSTKRTTVVEMALVKVAVVVLEVGLIDGSKTPSTASLMISSLAFALQFAVKSTTTTRAPY